MKPMGFKTATCTLLIALVLVVGGAMTSAASHELQHAAHHSAGSHSKGICAWMCATGAMAGQSSIHLAYTILILDGVLSSSDESSSLPSATILNSRAPPFLVS